ncbi:hypothetical protein BDV59DRAFT_189346 [Aspergillus ambiguus]|uniref:uncharacterized protein n=1 Tax=Aspergillus ambiguus TaxID=176160 RepID=UPI003CCDDA06
MTIPPKRRHVWWALAPVAPCRPVKVRRAWPIGIDPRATARSGSIGVVYCSFHPDAGNFLVEMEGAIVSPASTCILVCTKAGWREDTISPCF